MGYGHETSQCSIIIEFFRADMVFTIMGPKEGANISFVSNP